VEERDRPPLFLARAKDHGPGIRDLPAVLEGRYRSQTGMGIGITGARRLMDYFHIESAAGQGATVLLGKKLPLKAPIVTARTLAAIADRVIRQTPQNPFEEIQQQNQELLRIMQELKERQEQLEALNRELEDTNRGIVALYAELDEKASHLNRANELKARFLSNMSHELRTPLNSILALARLLIDRVDGELTDEQEKQAVFIKKAAEDLSTLVNDLLDIARIEAGKTVVHAAGFDAGNLFSALRGMFKPLLVNPAVALVFEAPEGLPALCTDEGKVSQILRNFLSNAIKFTEKGEIRVFARPGEGRSVIFSVSDTGIGIAADDLERIFEEYAQVDSPLQKKVKGTGLGLSLARKLAELLGGRVSVESTPGVGSTFSAVIPAIYAEPQAGEPSEPAPPDITRRPVLIIDDEEVARYILKGQLADTKFTVLEASGGREGLKRAEEEQPSVIFLDLMMPDMDGFETLSRLKASPKTEHIPVIILTSKVLDEAERRDLNTRAITVLSKESTSREEAAAKIREAVQKLTANK
jgi:signal transduction histidine kinase